jgi:hypothetical protein
MDPGFGPDEWLGVLVVGFDEGIDVLAELGDGSERGAVQRLSLQDREPDFDLVEPGGPRRREVETHVRMTFEPAIVPGLVGVQVVEDDMDGGTMSFMKSRNSTRRRRFLCAAVTLPVATSKAANSVVVPFRL